MKSNWRLPSAAELAFTSTQELLQRRDQVEQALQYVEDAVTCCYLARRHGVSEHGPTGGMLLRNKLLTIELTRLDEELVSRGEQSLFDIVPDRRAA